MRARVEYTRLKFIKHKIRITFLRIKWKINSTIITCVIVYLIIKIFTNTSILWRSHELKLKAFYKSRFNQSMIIIRYLWHFKVHEPKENRIINSSSFNHEESTSRGSNGNINSPTHLSTYVIQAYIHSFHQKNERLYIALNHNLHVCSFHFISRESKVIILLL